MSLLARFSRISTTGRFIPEIDGLRFLAIAAVVLFHLSDTLARQAPPGPKDYVYIFLAQGWFGVELFFAISGYILSLPFAEAAFQGTPRPPLGAYYLRRLTRLEPPYLINLALVYAGLVLFGGGSARGLLPHLGATAVYLHTPVYGDFSLINGVTWSLEIEVQFYLLAPLLAAVFRIRSAALRRGLIAAAMTILAAAQAPLRTGAPVWVQWTLLFYLQFFLVGFLLADLTASGGLKKSSRWDLAGAVAWILLVISLVKVGTPRALLPWLMLVAYLAALQGPLFSALFSRPWIATIGGMCYTIYLYHVPLMTLLWPWLSRAVDPARPFAANVGLLALLFLPPLLVAGALLFLAFERPFMRRGWYRRRVLENGAR